jgi:ribosomal protein S2
MCTSNLLLNCQKTQIIIEPLLNGTTSAKKVFRSLTIYKQQLIMVKLFNTQAYLGSQLTSSSYQRFLYGFRNEIAIIHLDSTLRCLRRACRFLIRSFLGSKDNLKGKRCEVFFVNENPEYNALIRHTARRLNQNYSNDKWVGGLLTNWEHIQVVFEDFKTVSAKLISVKTKTNNDLFLLKSLPRFKKWVKNFEGLVSNQRPDCLIALNGNFNSIAIKEASCLGIPIIALIDSNISKDLQKAIGYPIPGNTASLELVYVLCNSLVKSVESVS